MSAPAVALLIALVAQDQTPLRASAHENAPRQTTLAAGDWLEVRGERQGYLQVYDHRRERPGYVRASAVRTYPAEEAMAPKLGVIVDYLKDAPGQESLGIGYSALYLKVAPAKALGPEIFDAIGTMAERLAQRASARVAKSNESSLAGQLDAAESYGVHFSRFDRDGQTHVCYDGEAFRRVVALGGSGAMRAHAALALTEPSCLDPATLPSAALATVKWQSEVLDKVDPSAADVTAHDRAMLQVRRATVRAMLAYYAARTGDIQVAKDASEGAKRALALADRAALGEDARLPYDEAALRVASVRGAKDTPATSPGLAVGVTPGAPGQTCVHITPKGQAPFDHCTYSVVWPSSLRIAPHDAAVTLAASPLPGWNELLVFRRTNTGWAAEALTPATLDPDLGYVETAGFSPDGAYVFVVREWRASGPLGAPNTLAPWTSRTFQQVAIADLHVEKQKPSLADFPVFRKWQSPDWVRDSVALR